MPPESIALAPVRAKHLPRFRRASVEDRPAFRLTDRDREAMKIIFENRWITAQKLQDLLSEVHLTDRQLIALARLRAAKQAKATKPPQAIKREIRRRLQYLYHAGFVQRKKLSDGEAIAYALGNRGADELMLYYGIDRKEIEWTTKNRECGEHYIRHALMVTSLRHAIEVSLRDEPDLHLEMWKPGGAYQESVEYEDQVSTRAGTRTEIVKGTVKPDSLFVLRDRVHRIHYFAEADRSTMTNARYLKKLKDYYAYWLTGVKDNPKSAIQQMRVLTITRSEERKKNLRKIADEVSDEAKNLFWFICEKAYLDNPQKILEDTWQTLEDTLEDKNETFRCLYPHE